MRQLTVGVGVLSVVGWMVPGGLEAATCTAQARYVSAKGGDAKGFKQSVKLAVAASATGHGLVSYTISYKDKDGASQTKTASVPYKFAGGGAASGGGGGSSVSDETVLEAGACTAAAPCSIVSASVTEVSCFKDPSGRCAATAAYGDSQSKDGKGFKQAVNFTLSSADCGASCHGLVKYALKWKDKDGAEKTSAKSVPFKMSAGGAAGEVEIVDDTVLGATQCTAASPCTVTGATIDKVSCFADR